MTPFRASTLHKSGPISMLTTSLSLRRLTPRAVAFASVLLCTTLVSAAPQRSWQSRLKLKVAKVPGVEYVLDRYFPKMPARPIRLPKTPVSDAIAAAARSRPSTIEGDVVFEGNRVVKGPIVEGRALGNAIFDFVRTA